MAIAQRSHIAAGWICFTKTVAFATCWDAELLLPNESFAADKVINREGGRYSESLALRPQRTTPTTIKKIMARKSRDTEHCGGMWGAVTIRMSVPQPVRVRTISQSIDG